MIKRIFKWLSISVLALFGAFYLFGVIVMALKDDAMEPYAGTVSSGQIIAIFGASGTAGDGILKAALADSAISTIHVVTRRATPRIEAGVAAGKVVMTTYMDYLDYSAVIDELADVTAVYWAIGISSIGMDEETYGRIHVDFPAAFVEAWLASSEQEQLSFHYISSSDISEDSSAMWAREKVRAEKTLFALAASTRLKVIAYRPDYIGPTAEEAHLGQDLLYGFFAPVGAAVRATEIGKAMLEVTARTDEYENGARLSTRKIVLLSDAYGLRTAT